MEATYKKQSVSVSDDRSVAAGQNGAAIAPTGVSPARPRRPDFKGWEHTSAESPPRGMLGTMAAVFAHEVANPLCGISFGLELLRKSLESAVFDSVALIATVDGMMVEIHRLASLLKEFRDVATRRNINLQKTDLVNSTKEVLSCQCDAYRTLGITVEIKFHNPLRPVLADADKLKQVVLNLCNNAAEAMPDGGYLTIAGYHFGQMVVLEISDTGTGIPEGLDVFELFRTTKPGGSGLGLPLVREIVSAHHGTIDYARVPEPGRGTTFKVLLPAADSDS
jgi:signal transduction histidine kinase